MAATLIQSPDPLSFSLNPVVVKIAGSNWLSAAGVKAINHVTFSGSVSAAATIILKWGTFTLPFVAAASPDDSGLSFPSGDGSASYVETLLPYFQENYLIARDFEVTRSGQALIFTARETGSLYSFTPATATNISAGTTTPGITQAIQPNYGNFIEIWMEKADGTGFEKIHEKKVELDFPYTGASRYDISGILHSHLDFEKPDLESTAMVRCASSRRRYYLKVAEIYGVTPAKRAMTQYGNFTVIMGGLSFKGQQFLTASAALNPVPGDATQRRFLKNDGNTKVLRIDQPEFIHYISHAAHASLSMQIKAYFTDDTQAITSKSIAAVALYDKIEIPATCSQIIDAGIKTISKYDIWLEASGGRVSEIRTYILDYSQKQYIRFFAYKSSLGGLDSRMLYGKGSNELEIFQETAERGSRISRSLAQGERIDHSIEIQDVFSVATGFMSRADLLRMRDFYNSDEKFLISAGEYFGISVTSKKVEELQDGRGLFAQKFEYLYRFKDSLFTEGDGEDNTGSGTSGGSGGSGGGVSVPPPTGNQPGTGVGSNRHEAFVIIDSYAANNALYVLTRDANQAFVITLPDGTVLFRLDGDAAITPPPPVPVTVNFAMDEITSGQDCNLQLKVYRAGAQVDEQTLFFSASSNLTAYVGDTISIEGFSVVDEPASPAWDPGASLTLQVSGYTDLTTSANPGSVVRSITLNSATTININCFTTA